MNALKETIKYSSGLRKIFDANTPAQLIFFVTNRCNARCKHCFYWKNLNKDPKNELTLGEIKKISKSMGKIFWLFISGGEPFLRTDLAEICTTFYKNNSVKSIVIPTNGALAESILKITEDVAKNCPNAKVIIQISIDDIGKKHDLIRGIPGLTDKIKELVPKLKKLKAKYPNIGLQANTVFMAYNQDRIIGIYNYIYNEFKLDNICLSLVRGEPKEVGAKKIDLKKYYQAHQYLRKTKRFAHYTPLLSHLITKKEDMQVDVFLRSAKEKRAIIPCLVGKQSTVLYSNGNLAACEIRKEIYGNLRDVNYDFNKLWQSKQAEIIRSKVKGCFCTQECVYTTNVFLNPKVWPIFAKYLTLGTT